jgi:GAF domain-containing protein
MSPPPPISPLRGLLEVTKLMRAEVELPVLLAAIARTISESLGYRTVAVSLYRPAWDDFCVATVHGSGAARARLLGHVRRLDEWQPLLDARFERRGAYVVESGAYDWDEALGLRNYVADATPGGGENAWQPEDALFLPMRHSAGHVLGILSVDEPVSGRRATDEELDVLVALAEHAALAVQSAQEAAEAARHRRALEQLLDVSSRLTLEPVTDEILRAVCSGVRDALGFQNVLAALLDPESGSLEPRVAVGWVIEEVAQRRPVFLRDVEGLLDPEFELEGCYLVPNAEAERRIASDEPAYESEQNGLGPWAWDHHWLLVPLHSSGGEVIGVLWADEPADRLLPSRDTVQALRVFANQAAAAVVAAAHLHEVRFLADHDPLTRRARDPLRPHLRARGVRPRRLQGAERPGRARGGRRGVAAVRAHAPGRTAERRRGVPNRRRRVRASARGGIRGGCARGRPPHHRTGWRGRRRKLRSRVVPGARP